MYPRPPCSGFPYVRVYWSCHGRFPVLCQSACEPYACPQQKLFRSLTSLFYLFITATSTPRSASTFSFVRNFNNPSNVALTTFFGACASINFCQDVLYSGILKHRTCTRTGDYTGTGTCRQHCYGRCPEFSAHRMRQCSVNQRYLEHLFFGFLDTLFNGLRHFISLAVSDAYCTVAVAHNNQCRKTESSAAFDNLGTAEYFHHCIFQRLFFLNS